VSIRGLVKTTLILIVVIVFAVATVVGVVVYYVATPVVPIPRPMGYPAVLRELETMRNWTLQQREERWVKGNMGFAEFVQSIPAGKERDFGLVRPSLVEFYRKLTPEGAKEWFRLLQEGYAKVGPQYGLISSAIGAGLEANDYEGWKKGNTVTIEVDPDTWEIILGGNRLPTLKEVVVPGVRKLYRRFIPQDITFKMMALAKERYVEALKAYREAVEKLPHTAIKELVEHIDTGVLIFACDEDDEVIMRAPIAAIRANYAYYYFSKAIAIWKIS